MASSALRHRSKSLTKLLCSVTLIRTMGGGPRTFPGGLSKWQFKHMHEKLAREKERRLLQQEKQIYESRLRTEIRAKIAGKSIFDDPTASSAASAAGRMSSKDHIRALADRFMKEGAEDLWNENDGPIRAEPRPRSSNLPLPKPLDLRKIVTEKGAPVGSLEHRRHYSSWSRNVSSDDDEDGNLGSVARVDGGLLKFHDSGGRRVEALRFQRFSIDNKDSEKDLEHGDGGAARKKMMSWAALKKYDVKMKKGRPRRPDIEENDLFRELPEFHEGMRSSSALENGKKREEVAGEFLLTQKRFDECNISPLTIKALSSAGYVNMTVVQEAALPVCLEGKDVLVKAKTGTGKSAAFLLPAIEAVVRGSSTTSTLCMPPIVVLILSPTRELAIQLAAEANVLLKHHDGVGIQKLIGGTRFKLDQKHLEENPCQIIVATPGRLLDHIENKSGFSVRLLGLKMIILDEADHLLDLGFRKDVEKIVDCIPRQRQSLLFSATIPRKVRRVSQLLLKRDHIFVDTVGLGCVETHEKVGIPPDREQYIHRLGRTGREGKDGEGILLLAPWEEYFMNEINDLPIERCQLPELGLDMKQKVERSIEKIDLSIKEAAYHAWLGYYNSIGDIGRDKTTLVELANRFCQSIGLDRPPALFRKTALKMGLKNIPGIRIRK